MKNVITINIGDDTYKITASENEQYMRKVAGFVSAKSMEAAPGQRLSAEQRLLVTSLNIAEEYLKLLGAYDELKQAYRRTRAENEMLKGENSDKGGNA
ncbi:MAG: cell division protein ZapA [Oscillospiraceae bacterium]|nr:cell division protein ZapA [Oscillospiraceae bacterium]